MWPERTLPRHAGKKFARPRIRIGAENSRGRPLVADETILYENHAMRRLAREAHLVAHHHHGHPGGLRVPHHGEHASNQFRVHPRGGLVKHHVSPLEPYTAPNALSLTLP